GRTPNVNSILRGAGLMKTASPAPFAGCSRSSRLRTPGPSPTLSGILPRPTASTRAGNALMRLLSLPLVLLIPAAASAADAVDYKKDIRPVLQARCYACHGALAQKKKLRVDSGANLLAGGVVVPGKPGE